MTCECGNQITQTFIHPETQKKICTSCALKVAPEKWKTDETREILKDVALCREHRKGLQLPDRDFTEMPCGSGFICFDKCPVPKRTESAKNEPPKNTGGLVGGDCFEKKKQKEPTRDTSFMHMQLRVLEKLAIYPEIYEALDDLSSREIVERLTGKTSVAKQFLPQHGGVMGVVPSDETKKMFANLEEQFAAEDEKTGKKPYDFGESRGFQLTWEPKKWEPRNLPMDYKEHFDGERLKLCKKHRTSKVLPNDYRKIDCNLCLAFEDCPIWAKKDEKNGQKTN